MNRFIKKKADKIIGKKDSDSRTDIMVKTTLAVVTVIFIINSLVGFYSTFQISNNTRASLNDINLAKSAVVEIQNQFHAWKNILISGNRYSGFQQNYYEFSQHSQKADNILFNLKLEANGNDKLISKIDRVQKKHGETTSFFTREIVRLNDENFRNINGSVERTRGKDRELIKDLNQILRDIEFESRERSIYITTLYGIIAVTTFLAFIMLIIIYGRETVSKLINTHKQLEEKVIERTREIWQMNLELTDEITEHKKTEKKLIEARNEAMENNARLIISESRYRSLIEGTGDIIFTMDEELNLISSNNSVKDILKISPEKISNFNLSDLLGSSMDDLSVTKEIIIDKVRKAITKRKAITFFAEFKSPNLIEAIGLDVSLEFIEFDNNLEILGKAFRNTEARYTRAFVSEKTEYNIENKLFDAEDISHKVTENLNRYIPSKNIPPIRIGIREMLINAIEHGNLNISFEEKTQAMIEDRYFELINERRKLPEYRETRVKLEFMISRQKAVYKITDQGKGFNHKKMLAQKSEADEFMLEHGRGITMTKGVFDEISYNKRGNQVLLVKYLNESGGNESEM